MHTKHDITQATPYPFIMSDITLEKAYCYFLDILQSKEKPGLFLTVQLQKSPEILESSNLEAFIAALIKTKPNEMAAEAQEFNGHKNWNAIELSILGDISSVVNVQVYDNGGRRGDLQVHAQPFDATLIFVPGPLLEYAFNPGVKVDYEEVCPQGSFDTNAHTQLCERRFLPAMYHVQNKDFPTPHGKKFISPIPGIGAGVFAGEYSSQVKKNLHVTLQKILHKQGKQLNQYQALWFDNYDVGQDETTQINGIDLLIRPLRSPANKGKQGKHILCPAAEYGAKYKDCHPVFFVAWDPVSKQGNEAWIGNRSTDDGIKALATSALGVIMGQKGFYDSADNKFKPRDYRNWDELAKVLQFELTVDLHIYSLTGNKLKLQKGCISAEADFNYVQGNYRIDFKDSKLAHQFFDKMFSTCSDFIQKDPDNEAVVILNHSKGRGTNGVYRADNGAIAIHFSDQKNKNHFENCFNFNGNDFNANAENLETLYFLDKPFTADYKCKVVPPMLHSQVTVPHPISPAQCDINIQYMKKLKKMISEYADYSSKFFNKDFSELRQFIQDLNNISQTMAQQDPQSQVSDCCKKYLESRYEKNNFECDQAITLLLQYELVTPHEIKNIKQSFKSRHQDAGWVLTPQ